MLCIGAEQEKVIYGETEQIEFDLQQLNVKELVSLYLRLTSVNYHGYSLCIFVFFLLL